MEHEEAEEVVEEILSNLIHWTISLPEKIYKTGAPYVL